MEANLYVQPRSYVEVTSACPDIRAEDDEPDAKPDVNAVWVSGHWTWSQGWAWASGSWKVPRPGYSWEPPVCVSEGGSDRFYPGYFRPSSEAPPPVYRAPEANPMSCPPPASVRPSGTAGGSGTVTVRPGETVRPSQGTGTTTTVRPAENRSGETVRPSQGTGTTTTVRPAENGSGETVRPSQGTGTTTTVRPAENGSGETVRPSQGTGTTTTVRPEPLACQLRIARVPRNGRIVVVGTGFTADTIAEVGGTVATIARWTATELSVEAASAGSGPVTVVQGDERAACGRVTVF